MSNIERCSNVIVYLKNYRLYCIDVKDCELIRPEYEDSLIWTCETGPYYITKGYNAVLGSLGGVDVTNEMQVVTENNEIIKGLYSTGNNVSGLSVAPYVNVEGTGLGFALTSGRLAGTSAAEYAGK